MVSSRYAACMAPASVVFVGEETCFGGLATSHHRTLVEFYWEAFICRYHTDSTLSSGLSPDLVQKFKAQKS